MVALCQYDILLCHDHAYSEMAYDGYKPVCCKSLALWMWRLSFTVCLSHMTGWRFCGGVCHAIKGLGQVKTNVDSGVFKAFKGSDRCLFHRRRTSP